MHLIWYQAVGSPYTLAADSLFKHAAENIKCILKLQFKQNVLHHIFEMDHSHIDMTIASKNLFVLNT
jgi:hypothetical protein